MTRKTKHNLSDLQVAGQEKWPAGLEPAIPFHSTKAGWFADFAWLPWALLALVFVLRFQVDIPTIDQWEGELPFLQKVAQGEAKLSDLTALQLEHRIGFTRVVSVLVAWLSGWNSRFYSLVTWILMCLLATFLCLLNRRTCGFSIGQRFVLNFFGGSILFGLAQYDLWINAMMSSWVGIELMLLGGIYVAMSQWSSATKFLVCASISFVATFSSSMGIQLWILLPPILLVYADQKAKWPRGLYFGWWIAVAAFAVALYFSGYRQPAEAPATATSFLKLLGFFIAAQGSPFAYGTVIDPVITAWFAGTVSLVVYGVCLAAVLYLWREKNFVRISMPWISLAAFGVISCMAISLGRAGFPMDVALAARYITPPAFSIYMLFAVFPLILKRFTASSSDEGDPTGPKAPARSALIGSPLPFLTTRTSTLIQTTLVTTACFFHLCFSIRSVTSFENENIRYSAGKAAVLFSRLFLDRELLSNVWFERLMPKYQVMVDFMDQQSYLRPKTFRTARVYDLPKVFDKSTMRPGWVGRIEQFGRVGDSGFGFSGWAFLPELQRPPDVVLLSYGNHQEAVVFGIIPVGGRRPDIEAQIGLRPFKGCGWARVFPKEILPSVPTQIRAWAFDCDSGTAYELGDAIDFSPP